MKVHKSLSISGSDRSMRHPRGVKMKRLGTGLAPLLLVLAACPEKQPPPRRAELRKISGNSVRVIPAPGQLPYCLVFTLSATGVIRQLTMEGENLSLDCPAGEPIGGGRFRVASVHGPGRGDLRFFYLAPEVREGTPP